MDPLPVVGPIFRNRYQVGTDTNLQGGVSKISKFGYHKLVLIPTCKMGYKIFLVLHISKLKYYQLETLLNLIISKTVQKWIKLKHIQFPECTYTEPTAENKFVRTASHVAAGSGWLGVWFNTTSNLLLEDKRMSIDSYFHLDIISTKC